MIDIFNFTRTKVYSSHNLAPLNEFVAKRATTAIYVGLLKFAATDASAYIAFK